MPIDEVSHINPETLHITTPKLLSEIHAYIPTAADSDVVIAPGWPDYWGSWEPIAQQIASLGYRVFIISLRGSAGTEYRDKSISRSGQLVALAQDIIDIAQELELKNYHLIGHDWGGRAAFLTAILAPETLASVTVLSSGWKPGIIETLTPPQAMNFWYHWYFHTPQGQEQLRSHPQELIQFIRNLWSNDTISTDDSLAHAITCNPDWTETTISYYHHRWGNGIPDPSYSQLELKVNTATHITVPCCIIHGGADPCVPAHTSLNLEPYFTADMHRVELTGVGHFPHIESPLEVIKTIVDHITQY